MTLSSQLPQLEKEWHSSKNGGKTLDQFTVGSKKKAMNGKRWFLFVHEANQVVQYATKKKEPLNRLFSYRD